MIWYRHYCWRCFRYYFSRPSRLPLVVFTFFRLTATIAVTSHISADLRSHQVIKKLPFADADDHDEGAWSLASKQVAAATASAISKQRGKNAEKTTGSGEGGEVCCSSFITKATNYITLKNDYRRQHQRQVRQQR